MPHLSDGPSVRIGESFSEVAFTDGAEDVATTSPHPWVGRGSNPTCCGFEHRRRHRGFEAIRAATLPVPQQALSFLSRHDWASHVGDEFERRHRLGLKSPKRPKQSRDARTEQLLDPFRLPRRHGLRPALQRQDSTGDILAHLSPSAHPVAAGLVRLASFAILRSHQLAGGASKAAAPITALPLRLIAALESLSTLVRDPIDFGERSAQGFANFANPCWSVLTGCQLSTVPARSVPCGSSVGAARSTNSPSHAFWKYPTAGEEKAAQTSPSPLRSRNGLGELRRGDGVLNVERDR